MLNFKKVMAAMVGCMLFAAFASGCGDDAKDSSSKAESSSESSSAVSSEAVNFTAPEIGEDHYQGLRRYQGKAFPETG